MNSIQKNIQKIQQEIGVSKVRILAVTKYVSIHEMIDAFNAGIRDFAENKVQDAEKKRKELPEQIEKQMIWHFIGHLQTNKVKRVVGNFEYIHSIDSMKLAECVHEAAKAKKVNQKVLIEINIAKEETKFGFKVDEIKEGFKELLKLNSINIVGLMTMAPYTEDDTELHLIFRELRELRDYLEKKYKHSIPELSMGMSNDYKIAVQEGATFIRLGQVIFK